MYYLEGSLKMEYTMDYKAYFHEARLLWRVVCETIPNHPYPKYIADFVDNPTPYEGLPDKEEKQRILNQQIMEWLAPTGK